MPENPSGLRNLLRHRMGYGGIIPPDARVAPDAFPEDKFPLYCPSCDYLLRGLPSERCPECGYTYERGRLLVEQYVIEQGRRNRKRAAKYARWTGVFGFGLAIINGSWMWAYQKFDDFNNMSIAASMRLFLGTSILGALLLFLSAVLSLYVHWRTGVKAKQVFAAIDKGVPTFKKARRVQWVLWVLSIIAFVCVFAWDSRENRGWERYYWSHPRHVLLCLGLAAVIGCLLLVGKRSLNRVLRTDEDTAADPPKRCE